MYEKLVEFFSKLADTFLLAFVLLFAGGLVLLVYGASGGWPKFNLVLVEPWNFVVASAGGLLIVAALTLLFTSRTATKLPNVKATIIVPSEGAAVKIPSSIYGSIGKMPAGYQLWLFNIGSNNNAWPHRQVKVANLKWQSELNASSFRSGDQRSFALYLVGASGQALITHYRIAGEALNAVEPAGNRRWPGLSQLTADMIQVSDRRDVTIL